MPNTKRTFLTPSGRRIQFAALLICLIGLAAGNYTPAKAGIVPLLETSERAIGETHSHERPHSKRLAEIATPVDQAQVEPTVEVAPMDDSHNSTFFSAEMKPETPTLALVGALLLLAAAGLAGIAWRRRKLTTGVRDLAR